MSLHIPVSAADHHQGALDAPVVLVEYGDYQCPACGSAYPLVKRLQRQFGDQLCLVFRNFPLTEVHPQALAAAIVAEYAATGGHFWQVHDLLYEHQEALGQALYARIAGLPGLSVDGLRQALEGGAPAQRVEADFEGGVRSGVNGTPCFFVNGRRFEPRQAFDELADVIQDLLAGSP